MKSLHSLQAAVLLLLCLLPISLWAQKPQTVPAHLRGYWEYPAQAGDWNGPLIGENFVEHLYTVYYATRIEQEANGTYRFRLRNNEGKTQAFSIRPIGKR